MMKVELMNRKTSLDYNRETSEFEKNRVKFNQITEVRRADMYVTKGNVSCLSLLPGRISGGIRSAAA
jgi:hypothetical protein